MTESRDQLTGGERRALEDAVRIPTAALGAGFLHALIDANRRCWHDLASGTHLIRASD